MQKSFQFYWVLLLFVFICNILVAQKQTETSKEDFDKGYKDGSSNDLSIVSFDEKDNLLDFSNPWLTKLGDSIEWAAADFIDKN